MNCCICGKEIKGYGNNPFPIVDNPESRCCDECNIKVIIERLKQVYSKDIVEVVRCHRCKFYDSADSICFRKYKSGGPHSVDKVTKNFFLL